MNPIEVILVGLLVLLIGGVVLSVYRHPDPTVFWSPLTLFAAIFAYYFVIGPLISLGFDNTFAYGIDLREMMWKAWLAGLLGLGAICAGFAIRLPPYRTRLVTGLGRPLRRRLWIYFGILLGLGLMGFAYNVYVSGQALADLLLPFHSNGLADDSAAEKEGLAAGNYLYLLINAFIPAFCLLTALQQDKPLARRLLVVFLPMLQVAVFYMSMGFRHRIVILFLAVSATTYLLRRKRPNPATMGLAAAGLVLLSGLIVLTRSYGRGLDLSQLADLSVADVFLGGFNDAGTFFTTALVIESFPATFPFVGLDPLWVAMTIPVPRALWPDKPYPAFLQYFEYLMGTQGQAVPVTGEHYMMAGWIGIVVGGALIGMIYRAFWEFYRANPGNPFVVVIYAVAWALGFPVINRGYLAQTCMEFFFDLLPLVLLFLVARKMMLVRGQPAARAGAPAVNLPAPAPAP